MSSWAAAQRGAQGELVGRLVAQLRREDVAVVVREVASSPPVVAGERLVERCRSGEAGAGRLAEQARVAQRVAGAVRE